MTEQDLQLFFKSQCKKHGILFFKLHCEGQRGFPDVLLIKDRKMVLVELKNPSKTGRLSKLQKKLREKIQRQGVPVFVIDNKAEINQLIEQLRNVDERF